jgi:hypothetical protein
MTNRLFSLCWVLDEVHWIIIGENGKILERSPCGFACEEDALSDLAFRV